MTKITELPQTSTVAPTDMLAVVTNPGTTPVTQRVAVSDLTVTAVATATATAVQRASNLSDLASPATARTNLGLGAVARLAVGTTTGTVAAGDDSRVVGANQNVVSIAALRALGASACTGVIQVLGYYAAGDGGGGQFYWSAGSVVADDAGITILPTGLAGAGRWVRNVVPGVVGPRLWGAVGNGVADDTAPVRAAFTYANAQRVTVTSYSNSRGRCSVFFTPGTYLVTGTILDASNITTRAVGIDISALPGTVDIVFTPAVANQILFNNPSLGWLTMNFRGIHFVSTVATSTWMLSTSSGGPQDIRFERCLWTGDWKRGLSLAGGNNNSEMKWEQCTFNGTYSDGFLFTDTANGSDQYVNYWFDCCKVEFSGGTFVSLAFGGSINVTGGSWVGIGTTAQTFFNFPYQASHSFGAQRLSVSGVRFEIRTTNVVVIDCAWVNGQILFANCDDSISTGVISATHDAYRFRFGGSQGPSVKFDSCVLRGVHTYLSADGGPAFKHLVTYAACKFTEQINAHTFAITSLSAGGQIGGLPVVRFENCVGIASDARPFDCNLNWYRSTTGAGQRYATSFKDAFGNVPTVTGSTWITLVLPLYAMVTAVHFYKEAAGASGYTTWTYYVKTTETTPTLLATFASDGAPWSTSVKSESSAGLAFMCNTDLKRTLQLSAFDIDQYGGDDRFVVVVEYIA